MRIQREEANLVLAALQVCSAQTQCADSRLPGVMLIAIDSHGFRANRTGDPSLDQPLVQLSQLGCKSFGSHPDDCVSEREQSLVQIGRPKLLNPAHFFTIEKLLKSEKEIRRQGARGNGTLHDRKGSSAACKRLMKWLSGDPFRHLMQMASVSSKIGGQIVKDPVDAPGLAGRVEICLPQQP